MSGLARHLVIRLRTCFSDPGNAVVLTVSALATLFFWPGMTTPSGPVVYTAVVNIAFIMWLALWPALPAIIAAGRVAATERNTSLMSRPVPALPVGRLSRMIAEAMVGLLPVLVAHVPVLFASEELRLLLGISGTFASDAAFRVAYAGDTLLGAALILPVLLMWLTPAASMEAMFWRPMVMAVVMFGAMKLGCLATPLSLLATSAVMSSIPLAIASRQWRFHRRSRVDRGGAASRSRLYRPPATQLRRDFMLRPLLVAALLAALELALVAVDSTTTLPHLTMYFGSTLVLSLGFGFLALRPMLSKQAIAGIWGAPGFRPGDFISAWSRMPVRREAVVKGVWLHGAVAAAAIWGVAIVLSVRSALAEDPTLGWSVLTKGSVGHIMLPLGLLLPSVPGLLLAAAVGDKRWSWICGLTLFLGLHVYMVSLIAGVPVAARLGVLAILAIVNLIGPLGLLRPPVAAAV